MAQAVKASGYSHQPASELARSDAQSKDAALNRACERLAAGFKGHP
jgi:hypothetical protein